eukprot:gnl/Spiro4/28451_TR14050_c0_g1_i1.p1 gnl/Spiro4/28451_TR14050_c0_g1~~gnl/Spiro4/28451_TR14050_c0_g1_i1.p1  ORF type:complete len:587 (+),score=181.80 gnl/Spiro4/28451_TR14050_c0_g1_i1:65-1762(+)
MDLEVRPEVMALVLAGGNEPPAPPVRTEERPLFCPLAVQPLEPRVVQKRKLKVLDEDEYVSHLDRIIQRDFFPDLPRMRLQYQYQKAVSSGNPIAIQEAREKLQNYRTPARTPMRTPGRTPRSTPARGTSRSSRGNITPSSSFDTPRGAGSATPDSVCSKRARTSDSASVAESFASTREGHIDSMTLDQYLNTYTSEDNASFDLLLDAENARLREKHAWIHEHEKVEQSRLMLRANNIENDGHLITAPYSTKNSLMFLPEGVPHRADEVHGGGKKTIVLANTRFDRMVYDDKKTQKENTLSAEAQQRLLDAGGGAGPEAMALLNRQRANHKYDLDDFFGTPKKPAVAASPQVNGYRFVVTPSPAPGDGGMSPFMTWGEVEGTPIIIDPWNSPGTGPAPLFTIKEPSKRELAGIMLAEKAAKSSRKRTGMKASQAVQASPTLSRMYSPKVVSSPQLSEAAKALIRSKQSPRNSLLLSNDSQLRASYGTTPKSKPGSTTPSGSARNSLSGNTPRSTPAPPVPRFGDISLPAPATHSSASSSSAATRTPCFPVSTAPTTLTDNLLSLP